MMLLFDKSSNKIKDNRASANLPENTLNIVISRQIGLIINCYVKRNMNPIKPMSSDLLRQRRNVIVLSSILWFLKYAKIEITKFSIFGIEFSSFKNPDSVYLALWIAWIYFAVRYYQSFVQEGLPNFKAVYAQILDDKSIDKISILVKEKFPQNMRKDVNYSTLKKWNWVYSGQVDTGSNGMGGYNTKNFEMNISKMKLFPEILYSCFYIFLNRTAFTDYLLPVIIATFVFIYCFHGWDGSMINFFKSLIT